MRAPWCPVAQASFSAGVLGLAEALGDVAERLPASRGLSSTGAAASEGATGATAEMGAATHWCCLPLAGSAARVFDCLAIVR